MFALFVLFAALCSGELIYESPGDVSVAVMVTSCRPALHQTLVNSAIWTGRRLGEVGQSVGVDVYDACEDGDLYDAIFQAYKRPGLLGCTFTGEVPPKVQELLRVLDVEYATSAKLHQGIIAATVEVLEALNWIDNVTVVAPNQVVLREFYRLTRRDWICVRSFLIYEYDLQHMRVSRDDVDLEAPMVIFGSVEDITSFTARLGIDQADAILAPLDGGEIIGAPDGSYVVQPLYAEQNKTDHIVPTPLLFEIAAPILAYVHAAADANCVNATDKTACIKDSKKEQPTPEAVLRTLKIEPLLPEFGYNVFRIENVTSMPQVNPEYLRTVGLQDYINTFVFNPLSHNLTVLEHHDRAAESPTSCFKTFERCLLECENFKSFELSQLYSVGGPEQVWLRPEPWVYAFLALAMLGVLLCLCILGFIASRLCRKSAMEGNPILTMLLLLGVSSMYAGVVPFALEAGKVARHGLYIARGLCVTLPYSFTLALLLSRTILLATVSREVGFMSHVAGVVQSFLALFIFAVQLALDLQLDGEDTFKRDTLLYLMSYNVILLGLLVFVTPLIAKSQRNYREGKYFTISVALLACCWSCWLPGYAVLGETWRDPVLCLGLVSTASVLLGAIFIPRTYLMTVSAAREQFNSALPSLATATSAMDIYRASTQPVYDCVNVAAINAANSLRSISSAPPPPPPQPDFYSCPDDDDDDDFEVTRCDTPPPDKVTRF